MICRIILFWNFPLEAHKCVFIFKGGIAGQIVRSWPVVPQWLAPLLHFTCKNSTVTKQVMSTRFLTTHTHRTPKSKKKTKWNITAEAVESRMKCEARLLITAVLKMFSFFFCYRDVYQMKTERI